MANVKLSNVIRRAQTKVDKDDTDLVFMSVANTSRVKIYVSILVELLLKAQSVQCFIMDLKQGIFC